jgi:hypothetical protein
VPILLFFPFNLINGSGVEWEARFWWEDGLLRRETDTRAPGSATNFCLEGEGCKGLRLELGTGSLERRGMPEGREGSGFSMVTVIDMSIEATKDGSATLFLSS